MGRRRRAVGALAGGLAFALALSAFAVYRGRDRRPVPSFAEQLCSLPDLWAERVRRGYYPSRSGEILLVPRTPAYMASGNGGWTHTGPWPYVQRVPLVFYGPGVIPARGPIPSPATLADVAPTLGELMGFRMPPSIDGRRLRAVGPAGKAPRPPKLVVVVVWDGGGWNVLERWPQAWPNLRRMMRDGTSYTRATVGSSPSVTPAIHTTLGTGAFPWKHGVTDISLRDEQGKVSDAFVNGESSRFIELPTLAESWDERNGNRALIAMIGYEPWHLGMIGKGAERALGDKDHAAWLHPDTNEWITNPEHYELPPSLRATGGLEDDLRATDARDGKIDGAWRDNATLDDITRIEEAPGFIAYHTRAIGDLIRTEGYGEDGVTDLVFTNYKQIDRNGHYFNMASVEVRDSLAESDRQLGVLAGFLDRQVGRGRWTIVLTADHGQQPDAAAIDGYAIDPKNLRADIDARFGPITRSVWPTQIFLHRDVMEERGVTVEEVARFVGGYRLADNTDRPDIKFAGAGSFDPEDRLFSLSIPSDELTSISCGRGRDGS